jgi:hypothetical protein
VLKIWSILQQFSIFPHHKTNFKKYSSYDAMLLYAGTHGCEEVKGSGKCGCLLVAHQAVVVNDAIVHCPLSIVYCPGFSNTYGSCVW